MKPKTPKCNPIGWVWIEMCGFESEQDRMQCIELLKGGYAHPFKKFLLKHAYDKIWFRVRQKDRKDAAWLNGPVPNHCTRLLQWLRDSKQHDDEFRVTMGWPVGTGRHSSGEPARSGPGDSAGERIESSSNRPLGASATWEIAMQRHPLRMRQPH